MTSKLVVNTIESDAGVSAVTFAGDISVTGSAGALSASTLSATNLTVNGNAYPNAGPLSNRNLIINGAMQVAQRGTSVTDITSSGYRTVDRFRPSMGTLGTWTIEQSTDAPDGFAYSHKFTCTTADASPAADDDIEMEYKVEAQDLQHLNYGSASAQAMTLSFWVKSNKTGAATVNILQPDNSNKSLSPTYTISSADTWEHKTISIPGDTAGAISNDNGIGLLFGWWLNSGSNSNSGTNQTTWTTLNSADKNASNLGVGGAVNDYWQITGVQLEVGTVATPFEHRSYGQELALCQRYYKQILALQGRQNQSFFISNYGTTSAVNIIEAGLYDMRASVNTSLGPTGNTGNVQYYSYGGTWTSSTLTASTIGLYPHQQVYLYATADGDGRGKLLRRSGASDPDIYVEIDAEL